MFAFLMLLQAPFGQDGAQALPRLLTPANVDCAELGGCSADDARRYRLQEEPAPIEDSMTRAKRGIWAPCETTGMPVCPSRPRQILRAELVSD